MKLKTDSRVRIFNFVFGKLNLLLLNILIWSWISIVFIILFDLYVTSPLLLIGRSFGRPVPTALKSEWNNNLLHFDDPIGTSCIKSRAHNSSRAYYKLFIILAHLRTASTPIGDCVQWWWFMGHPMTIISYYEYAKKRQRNYKHF